MASGSGTFDFQLDSINLPGEGEVTIRKTIVRFCLKQWTRAGRGAPVISPDLMSEFEIGRAITQLKADLDRAGTRAKAAFRAADARRGTAAKKGRSGRRG